MTDPRDRDLDDFLAGRSSLEELYRQTRDPVPPPELDRRIVAAAHRAAARPGAMWRWTLPAALAAVLVLAVSLTPLLIRERDLEPESAPSAALKIPPPPPTTRQEADAARPAEESRARLPAAASPAPETQPESPQQWLEAIAELRRQGRDAEAEASLREFRRRYPDHPAIK
ncbi:MAG: hypothetical protein M3Z21_04255 [Pseudomonadota bacterium]|nr:hypothetical protein [Pseudomonadota bacterium]